jgi:hypothetical protein
LAPGAGIRSAVAGVVAGGSGAWAASAQFSKSCVSKVFPVTVRAYSRVPSAEYQTASTGPVAGDASASSTAGPPTRRQSGETGAGVCTVCAKAAVKAAAKPASPRTVSLRHTVEFHCTAQTPRTRGQSR